MSLSLSILDVGNTELRTSVAKGELSLAIFFFLFIYVQISTTTEDIPEFDRTKVNLDIPPVVFGSGFTTITNISKILSNVITVSPSENSYKIKKYRDRDRCYYIVSIIYTSIIWTRDNTFLFSNFFFPFYGRSIRYVANVSPFTLLQN